MAFQMIYTDAKTGAIFPESYWFPAVISMNKQHKRGTITFAGFANAQARLDNKQPVTTKTYTVTPAMYDAYLATDAQNPEGQNPYSAAYVMALATLEGQVPPEGEEDNRASFFATATHV